jgi:hypothetical protein
MLWAIMDTLDLDIWLKVSSINALKIVSAINEFGMGSLGLTVADFLQIDNIIQIGYPPLRIDLLSCIDGVSFDDCYSHRVRVDHEGFEYNIISYDDLIKNKKASNRSKDLGDIENLTSPQD